MIAEVISLPKYEEQVSELMDFDERLAMEFFIASQPERHPVIPGTGGFRKARWALKDRGKSGGVRVIYFFVAAPGYVFMATVYSKSRQANISSNEKKHLEAISAEIKKTLKAS